MKTYNAQCILMLFIFFLSAIQQNLAQRYVCPNSTVRFYGNDFSTNPQVGSKTFNSVNPGAGNQVLTTNFPTYAVDINFGSSFTSTTMSADCFYYNQYGNPTPIYATCAVYAIIVKEVIINPGFTANENMDATFTASAKANFEPPMTTSNTPDVIWSIRSNTAPYRTICNVGRGPSLSFIPSDSLAAFVRYKEKYGEIDPSTTMTVRLYATYKPCSIENSVYQLITISPSPYKNIDAHITTPETCQNSKDGTVTISSMTLNGTTYANTDLPQGKGAVVSYKKSGAGGFGSNKYFNKVPFVLTDFSTGSYELKVERALPDSNVSGVYDIASTYTFNIGGGNETTLNYNYQDPLCNESDVLINLSTNIPSPIFSFDNQDLMNGAAFKTVYLTQSNPQTYQFKVRCSYQDICQTSRNVTIDFPNKVIVTDNTESKSICPGSTTFLSAKASGGGSNNDGLYSYSLDSAIWEGLSTNSYTPPVSTGAYTIYAKDKNNCFASSVKGNIGTLPAPLITTSSVTVTDAICPGGTGVITLNKFSYENKDYYTTDSTGFNFFIDGQQTNVFSYNIQDGKTQKLTIQKTSGCTSVPFNLQVGAPPAMNFNVSGTTPARCYNTSDGTASFSVTGGTSPYTVTCGGQNSATLPSNLIVTNLLPRTYSALVTDNKGCTFSINNVTVGSPPQLIVSISGSTEPTCYGGNNGSLSVFGTGGTGSYTYKWPDSLNLGNVTSANNLYAGLYMIKLTDDSNCSDSNTVVLLEPDPVNIPLANTIENCFNHVATLDAGNAGVTYHWVMPDGSDSTQRIIHTAEEGNYSVTVTDALGCTNTKNIFLDNLERSVEGIFLIASEATLTDTIVAIEVSWPVPDSIHWDIPDNFIVINDLGFYKELVPKETGTFTIGMDAYRVGCMERMEKSINITEGDETTKKLASGNELIKSLKLSPNPNKGAFELEVELARNANIQADLISFRGYKAAPSVLAEGNNYYLLDYNHASLAPGVYVVTIMAEGQMKRVKFVVQ